MGGAMVVFVRLVLGQVTALTARLQPDEQQQRAFGVGQGVALAEKLVHALSGQAEHAGQFSFFAAAAKLDANGGGEFVPQGCGGPWFDREPAPWTAFACRPFDALSDRCHRSLREGEGEFEGNCEWRG